VSLLLHYHLGAISSGVGCVYSGLDISHPTLLNPFYPCIPSPCIYIHKTLHSTHRYVLGLGDRHPSNLMLDRKTGKVLHIDFGDCFEVAMQRDKFPEKVPFRLTRMLVNAMEVAGIEGNYRSTCENVSNVLDVDVFWCVRVDG